MPATRGPSRGKASRAWLVALGALLLAGAGLRAAYLSELRHDPFFLSPALDPELHDYWARGLAFGSWGVPEDRTDPRIRTTPYFRPPGYPFALAAIYGATGGSPVASRVVQFSLGLVSAMLGFLLARRYAGAWAGVACAGLMATSWNLIFFEGELLDASLLALLTPAVLLLLRAAGDRGLAWAPMAAGLSIGAFALVRPNGLIWLPAAAGWLYWVRRRRDPATAWKAPAVLLLGGMLAVLPAALRNHAVSGEWILISANGGINLYIGNNPHADGVRAGIPDLESLAGIRGWTCFDYPLVVEGLSREAGRPLRYGEASRIWAAKARTWIGANAGRFTALTLKRLALFFGPSEIGDRDLDLTREASPVLRTLPGEFPWYLAAAIVGLGLAAIDHRRSARGGAMPSPIGDRFETAVLLGLLATTYVATFLPFFFNSRYRVPLLVILFVFASDAIVRGARLLGERRWRGLAPAVAAFAGIASVASLNPTGYEPDRGEWHYQRANAFRDARRLPEAVAEYEQSLRSSPRAVDPRRDLALLLRDQGRPDQAIELLRSALALDPHAFEARFDLAQILAAGGRFDAAAREFERVLADAPRHAHAHLSLGTALMQLGREPEAMEHYAEAESLAPRDPLVAFVVGRALLARGHSAEGISRLRRAVELAPGFAAARQALAAAGG